MRLHARDQRHDVTQCRGTPGPDLRLSGGNTRSVKYYAHGSKKFGAKMGRAAEQLDRTQSMKQFVGPESGSETRRY
eukprot:6672599-Pyramimonas_sp.AAC.1